MKGKTNGVKTLCIIIGALALIGLAALLAPIALGILAGMVALIKAAAPALLLVFGAYLLYKFLIKER